MSSNVVPLFGPKPVVERATPRDVPVEDLIMSIIDWAENQGVDVNNDIAFKIRLADFMTHLQLVAREHNGERKIA